MSCIMYCCYACRLYILTCDMYKSSLRHIHDPVLSSFKMKGIRLLFFFVSVALRPNAGHSLILEVSRSHTTTHHSQ
jgi:hypothetical protein